MIFPFNSSINYLSFFHKTSKEQTPLIVTKEYIDGIPMVDDIFDNELQQSFGPDSLFSSNSKFRNQLKEKISNNVKNWGRIVVLNYFNEPMDDNLGYNAPIYQNSVIWSTKNDTSYKIEAILRDGAENMQKKLFGNLEISTSKTNVLAPDVAFFFKEE